VERLQKKHACQSRGLGFEGGKNLRIGKTSKKKKEKWMGNHQAVGTKCYEVSDGGNEKKGGGKRGGGGTSQ